MISARITADASDDDVTAAILPTFFVLDHIKNAHIAPS